MANVADYQVLPGAIRLPRRAVGFKHEVSGFDDLRFELPSGVDADGALSFLFDAEKGMEDGIDVSFSIFAQGYEWGFGYRSDPGHRTLTLPVGIKAGSNSIRFQLTKGGAIQGSDNTVNFQGEGLVAFTGFVVWFRRPA